MTNYRRLISYIYAYEGDIKGKNIGFAKLESRNGQCKLSVNVKKVYVGSSDLGVYLLAPGREIPLGNIFIRGGSGEFRAVISVENAADSGCGLDQCYGLTIHEQNDSWRAYTTIWEDAVAHAAEVELADVTSGNLGNSETQIHKKVEELAKEINDKVLSSSSEPALPNTVPVQDVDQESMEIQGNSVAAGEALPVWGEDAGEGSVDATSSSEIAEQMEAGQDGNGEAGDGQAGDEQAGDTMASEIQPESGGIERVAGEEWSADDISSEYEMYSETEVQFGCETHLEGEIPTGYEAQPRAEMSWEYNMQQKECPPSWHGIQRQDSVQTEYGSQMSEETVSHPLLHSAEALRVDTDMDKAECIETEGQTMDKMRSDIENQQMSRMQPVSQFQPEVNTPFTGGRPHPVVLPDTSIRQQREMPYRMNRYPRAGISTDTDMSAGTNISTSINAPANADRPSNIETPSGTNIPPSVNPQPRRPMQSRTNLWHQRGEFLRTAMQPGAAEQPQPASQTQASPQTQASSQSQSTTQPHPASQPSPASSHEEQTEEKPRIIDYAQEEMLLGNSQELERLEQEEQENPGPCQLWEGFSKRYPKIQAFESANGCEILTIKPQDIGLLPRENWNYGNNSFLLHGYYNYRYLILARIGDESQGRTRYILGVPGHYYSNEKYMASMFGFPHFVLAKKQPSQDGRFGYWYRDVRMQNQD